MLSFIKNHLHNVSEFISLVIAIIYYPYLKKSFMRWVLPFLAFIFISEIYVMYTYDILHVRTSINSYYIIGIIETFFYGYLFHELANERLLKRAIVFFTFISITTYLLNFILYGTDDAPYLFSLILSGFLLSVLSLWYIYILFADDNRSSLIKESGFWIALGVSLFFSGTSIVFSLHQVILKNDIKLFGVKLYNLIPGLLCIVLYACISIAIILCKKKPGIL